MTDLSIIIVSWNVADLLVECLNSIVQEKTHYTVEVIVVDSASSDDTVERVRRDFPQVRLMAQDENLGFTRCNNIGLAAAKGRHVMLLNPDTVILDSALSRMIDYLDSHPDVGIVGPHTLNEDRSTQSSRRTFPTKILAFLEGTWLQPFAPRRLLATFYLTHHPDDAVFDVDWMQGSALMARRKVYEQIGGLDEGYIMYYEELDWCKRAKSAGWRNVYVGTAQIIHYGGKSTEQVAARKHIHFQESKLRYFSKYHGIAFATLLRLFLLASYVWELILETVKGVLGSKRELRRSRVQAYLQVLRSGLKVR